MEDSDPPVPDEAPVNEVSPTLQRRSLFRRADADAKPSDSLGSVIVYLSSLHADLLQREQNGSARAAEARTASVLKERRLPRTGAAPGEDFVKFGQRSDAGTGGPAPGMLPGVSSYEDFARPGLGWKALLAAGCVGFLGAAGIFWLWLRPEPLRSPPPTAPLNQTVGNAAHPPDEKAAAEAAELSNQFLDAVQHGQVTEASAVLDDARRRHLMLPGMNYQAALLAYKRGDEAGAEDWIDASVAANEFVPECLYLQANHAASEGDFEEAVKAMESATRAAPFSPRYFFFLAECLRRKGNPALALPQFEQAMRCRPTVADADLILFRMRLAMIESGKDAELQKQLADQLAQEPVPGDTLLLAAASAINHSSFAEGAAYLRRAAQVLPAALLRWRMRDYLFRSQAQQPDLAKFWAEFLQPGAPGTHAPAPANALVDPATRGLTEADPGGW